jgi:hypothetical protein
MNTKRNRAQPPAQIKTTETQTEHSRASVGNERMQCRVSSCRALWCQQQTTTQQQQWQHAVAHDAAAAVEIKRAAVCGLVTCNLVDNKPQQAALDDTPA